MDIAVRDDDTVFNLICEAAEPGTTDDSNCWFVTCAILNLFGKALQVTVTVALKSKKNGTTTFNIYNFI